VTPSVVSRRGGLTRGVLGGTRCRRSWSSAGLGRLCAEARSAAQFQLADQIAMTLLGIVLRRDGSRAADPAACVRRTPGRSRVRNVLGFTALPWGGGRGTSRFDDGDSGPAWTCRTTTRRAAGRAANDGEQDRGDRAGLRRLLAASREQA
jgi:hypothetical protein